MLNGGPALGWIDVEYADGYPGVMLLPGYIGEVLLPGYIAEVLLLGYIGAGIGAAIGGYAPDWDE